MTKSANQKALYAGKSVHILLRDGRGALLICKRPKTKKTYGGTFTSSAGGRVEAGESYMSAAKRELKEELGITVGLKDAGRFFVVNETESTAHKLFIGTISRGQKLIPDSGEISSYAFVPFSNLWNDTQRNPQKYAAPFLLALERFALQTGALTYIFDFDHTLFDWYRYKKDLVRRLRRLSVSATLFEKAKQRHEERSLYNIQKHLRAISHLSKVPLHALLREYTKLQKRLPSYIYSDARTLLDILKKQHANVIMLTYGDRKNQEYFIRGTGVHRYARSIYYTRNKSQKVSVLRKLSRPALAIVCINDDPEEAALINAKMPKLGRMYLVERPAAKYKKIARQPYYFVVRKLTDVELAK